MSQQKLSCKHIQQSTCTIVVTVVVCGSDLRILVLCTPVPQSVCRSSVVASVSAPSFVKRRVWPHTTEREKKNKSYTYRGLIVWVGWRLRRITVVVIGSVVSFHATKLEERL